MALEIPDFEAVTKDINFGGLSAFNNSGFVPMMMMMMMPYLITPTQFLAINFTPSEILKAISDM